MKKLYVIMIALFIFNVPVLSMKRTAEGTIEQGNKKKVHIQPRAMLYPLSNGNFITLNKEAVVLCDQLVDLLNYSQKDFNMVFSGTAFGEIPFHLDLTDDEVTLLFNILNAIPQSARSFTDPKTEKKYYLNKDVFKITVRMCKERDTLDTDILRKLINACDFLICDTLLNALTRQFIEGSKELMRKGFYVFSQFSNNSGAVPYLEKHLKRMALGAKLGKYIPEHDVMDHIIYFNGQLPVANSQINLNKTMLTSLNGLEIIAENIDKLSINIIHLGGNYLELTNNFFPLTIFPNLQSLLLSHNQLTQLPENIFSNLNQLQELDLSHNQLTQLPANIFSNLNQLEILLLSHNQLTQLPENIFSNLNQLQELDLSHNQLTQLPANIFNNLNQLEILLLSHNQLTQLPENIFSNLNQLRSLHLSHNQLTQFSENIFSNLNLLQILYLDNNPLTETDLPKKIQQLLKWLRNEEETSDDTDEEIVQLIF